MPNIFGLSILSVYLFSLILSQNGFHITITAGATAKSTKTEFHILALLPYMYPVSSPNRSKVLNYPFCKERVAPAIDIALEMVREKKLLDPKYRLSLTYADSECSSAIALNEVIVYYIQKQVCLFKLFNLLSWL